MRGSHSGGYGAFSHFGYTIFLYLQSTARYCTPEDRTKQTPWPLVRERTIPTARPPLVGEI
jgi:hypothetical protein